MSQNACEHNLRKTFFFLRNGKCKTLSCWSAAFKLLSGSLETIFTSFYIIKILQRDFLSWFEETAAFNLNWDGSFLEDVTQPVLDNLRDKAAVKAWGQCLPFMNVHLPHCLKTPLRFQEEVINMHIAWCAGLRGEGWSTWEGEATTCNSCWQQFGGNDRSKLHGWSNFRPWCWSIKIKCRHNTDWRHCSSFHSGARFHARFTVPLAWLIEACLPRKHKSAFSRDI